MKITTSVSQVYSEQSAIAKVLQKQVDTLIHSKIRNTWYYYSRIKKEESFALKLETGRVKDPAMMEDFFAGTIVVENINEIKNASEIIYELFDVDNRKPKRDDFTHKEPSSFAFDDLRFYLKLKKVDYARPGNLGDLVFELQIKTFLQHAWAIATHDMIYKSNNISWSKQRVAYQVKAMLEQAEISISGVDCLSQLPELAKDNRETKTLNEIVNFLTEVFPPESLPFDLLRLSGIVSDVLRNFKLELPQLRAFIEAETVANKGVKTLDLSPYGIIIQSIVNQSPLDFEGVFTPGYKVRSNGVFLPNELTLDKVNIADESNAIRINSKLDGDVQE